MSRGPAGFSSISNMPIDQYRQFTNSEYIPNDMLPYYAAPKSTGFETSDMSPPYPMNTPRPINLL